MDELLECARDSSGNFSRYENITGHKLMEWAEEKNIAPNFRLNTHFVNSSHFVEDCYMRMNSSGEPFLAIRGGIQFLAGRELSVYTFGDSCLYIARSKYPVLESIRDDLMEAFDS